MIGGLTLEELLTKIGVLLCDLVKSKWYLLRDWSNGTLLRAITRRSNRDPDFRFDIPPIRSRTRRNMS